MRIDRGEDTFQEPIILTALLLDHYL